MRYALLSLIAMGCTSATFAADWLTLPSSFSHDAAGGGRVSQYAPITGPTVPLASNFRTSGFTHMRSSLNYGSSADNYHRVERWGDPIRPYGEWRFPFRPYSTPYPNWGAPYAGLNLNFNRGYGNGFGGSAGYQPGLPRSGNLGRPGLPSSGPNPLIQSGHLPTPHPIAPYVDGYHRTYRD